MENRTKSPNSDHCFVSRFGIQRISRRGESNILSPIAWGHRYTFEEEETIGLIRTSWKHSGWIVHTISFRYQIQVSCVDPNWKSSYPRCRTRIRTNLRITLSPTDAEASLSSISGFWEFATKRLFRRWTTPCSFFVASFTQPQRIAFLQEVIRRESTFIYWPNLRVFLALNPFLGLWWPFLARQLNHSCISEVCSRLPFSGTLRQFVRILKSCWRRFHELELLTSSLCRSFESWSS